MIRTNFVDWDSQLATLPHPSILQTTSWARVKEQYGWQSMPVKWVDNNSTTIALAVVLKRQIKVGGFKLPISMLYVPKGPILDWENKELVSAVLNDLAKMAREENAFLIKIEPEISQFTISKGKQPEKKQLSPLVTPSFLSDLGWIFSKNQIQFRNSVFVDLTSNEGDILEQMNAKNQIQHPISIQKRCDCRRRYRKGF